MRTVCKLPFHRSFFGEERSTDAKCSIHNPVCLNLQTQSRAIAADIDRRHVWRWFPPRLFCVRAGAERMGPLAGGSGYVGMFINP
jgi:hypothetical protein